jgi:hypothetical protein
MALVQNRWLAKSKENHLLILQKVLIISVYESEIVSDRCSLASVNTELSVNGMGGRDKTEA